MWKTLNLELFKPGFIFSFKWNKHLVVKDYQTHCLCINLDYDDCEILEDLAKMELSSDMCSCLEDTIYNIHYLNILEDILHSDTLRWEDIDYTLLIEEENDNTDTSYS